MESYTLEGKDCKIRLQGNENGMVGITIILNDDSEPITGQIPYSHLTTLSWFTNQIANEQPKRRIQLDEEGEIRTFFARGVKNPCHCGSNCYHHELTRDNQLYGVCNACDEDIYEFDVDKDYIENNNWRVK